MSRTEVSLLVELIRTRAIAPRRTEAKLVSPGESETSYPPFVVGIAGGVAVGKSTLAQLLAAGLRSRADGPRVDIVSADAFLRPNRQLEFEGLIDLKGFPETYDWSALRRFLKAVKSGARHLRIPVYSHLCYDIVAGDHQEIDHPDIMLLEGLHVLRDQPAAAGGSLLEFVDLGAYLDAAEADMERWYVERFLALREVALGDPGSASRYRSHGQASALETARLTWREINLPNLRTNIAPTRQRAHVIADMGPDHALTHLVMRPASDVRWLVRDRPDTSSKTAERDKVRPGARQRPRS